MEAKSLMLLNGIRTSPEQMDYGMPEPHTVQFNVAMLQSWTNAAP